METTENGEGTSALTKSVLDAFSDLCAEDETKRIDATMQLLQHLSSQEKTGQKIAKEKLYTCKRLIRGLGSGREIARKGYYAAFVTFIFHFPTFPLQDIFDILNKELEMGKFGSKGEEGEVCSGRLLAFGALIRSGHFQRASSEDKKYILNQMFEASNQKSYLPQLLPSFFNPLLVPENKLLFREILWPVFASFLLKPWSEQSLDSFYLLLKVVNVFPSVVKRAEVKNVFGGSPIIKMESLQDLSTVLFNSKGTWHRHPVYKEVCQVLSASPNLAVSFWHSCVDSQLLGPKSSRSKGSLALEIFCSLLYHLKSSESVPQLLTPRFISLLRQRCARLPLIEDGSEEMRLEANAALSSLINILKSSDTSDCVRVECLEKIVTASRGDFGFDHITKSNVIHSIVMALKSEGLTSAATLCQAVISGESHPCRGDDEESNDSLPSTWLNKDRISAIHLLATLAIHPAASSEFQADLTLVLVKHAFFPPPGCTSLCLAAKEGLLRCIAATSPSSEPLTIMTAQLSNVVSFINNKLSIGQKPYKASKEVLDSWKKMMTAIGKLKVNLSSGEGKNSKVAPERNLSSVLLMLFMQLGVQLFLDPELAHDSLEELHMCVEKAGLTKQKTLQKAQKDEPHWVEVVTDLFLSLLSQNSSMLRNIVNRVFSAMCPLMTKNALLSLVEVVDCSAENNPLCIRSDAVQSREESFSIEKDDEDNSNVEDTSEEEEMQDEDQEKEEDTISDRVRAAVRDALGDAAEVTDTESVDVDDISEEEGQKLNDALSQAFAVLRKSGSSKNHMNKKQLRDNKEIVHFRVRIMDLIDTYMHSEQSLYLVCSIISPLFHALEACLKDVTQKPLESRLRNCLRKLSTVKKFANLNDMNNDTITSLLRSLIEKGDRTAAVFLDISHEVCAVSTFLVKCSQLIADTNPGLMETITDIYVAALNKFFYKRDCLLPPMFFSMVLKSTWIGNFLLWPHLITAAFENDLVRPFRKSQALTLLREFASNEKLLSQYPEEKAKLAAGLISLASQILSRQTDSSNGKSSMKPRFFKELYPLLVVVHQHSKESAHWNEFALALHTHFESVQSKQAPKEIKKIFKKLHTKFGISENSVNVQKIEKTEFVFAKPKPIMNGSSHESNKVKKRKSEEKKNVSHIQEKSSRRKAKELRLSALSDGMDEAMDFSAVNLELCPQDL